MDYPEQRQKYLKVYPNYLKDLKLNDPIISLVKKFSPTLWEVVQNPSDEAIKSYILLELTKTRESCAQIIQFLRATKNDVLADGLQEFNTSPGRQSFGDEVNLPVTPVLPTEIKLSNTRNYPMTKNPRGKAIIINLLPDEVKFEAQRFYFIFEQLLFEPQLRCSLTTYQIKEQLEKMAVDMIGKRRELSDQAIIVMVISHGVDGKILGKDHPDCKGKDKNDFCPIADIVNIFAKVEDTKKIFFFTCCRTIERGNQNMEDMKHSIQNNTVNNTNTYIFYSTAEGYESSSDSRYTYAGRKLSESFAQYAHFEHLTEIIQRTNQALEKEPICKGGYGDFSPEASQRAMTHSLYFNPGWYEGKY